MAPVTPYAQSLQSCPTLCDPMECSLPGSSVHGIFLARILEQVAMSSSSGSSWPRDQTPASCISCIDRRILYQWATCEAIHVNITKRNHQIYQRSSSRNFCLILLIFRVNICIYLNIDANTKYMYQKIYTHIYVYTLLCLYTHTSLFQLTISWNLFLMDSFFFFLEYVLISEGLPW